MRVRPSRLVVAMSIAPSPAQSQRLNDESIIWLATVNAHGAPAPTPVWFLWTGVEFLMFSRPDTGKLSGIARNPAVSLNLNSDASGGSVLVVTGTAVVDEDGVSADEWAAYLAKYRQGIVGIGSTPETFRTDYSVLLRITPEKLRGW
jgi:PPOX class probable F420-dependent enzyme